MLAKTRPVMFTHMKTNLINYTYKINLRIRQAA